MTEKIKAVVALVVTMTYIALLVVKLWPLWRSPLRRIIASCRRPAMEILLLVTFVIGIVRHGATKGTNGTDRGEEVPSPTPSGVLPPRNDGATDDELRFVSFAVYSNAVAFAAVLPIGFPVPEGKIDLYATCDLATNFWEHVGYYDIAASETNLFDTVLLSDFPFAAIDRLFLRLGTRADLDDDGLIDVREKLMYGTSPMLSDTDGDGLLDGEEQSFVPPLDPLSADTDGDGFIDSEELIVGMNPLTHDNGAELTIRYHYDDDDRLTGVHSGIAQASSVISLTPAGNSVRQASR